MPTKLEKNSKFLHFSEKRGRKEIYAQQEKFLFSLQQTVSSA
jgi:hypothetical protein